jgi:hypothetical protein
MTTIKNVSGQLWATMSDDRKVHSVKNVVLGYVEENGQVHNNMGHNVGYFEERNGYVHDQTNRHVGTVRVDGHVFDYENQLVGTVEGDHIMLAGAALLLLIR